MTILIAPDKFKGSLTSFEVAAAIQEGLQQQEGLQVKAFPFADGGDGFAAVMKHYLQTETVYCRAVNPLGREISALYEWDAKNKTAIIEMAVASGLVLLKEEEKNPLKTSSYGTGLMIQHAIENGSKKIILGLGGSATNDAGMGILAAMGFQFVADNNAILPPCGRNLAAVKKIIKPAAIPAVQFELACDVQNVLYGPQGAAYIYAPQKGADAQKVIQLDNGLRNFATVIKAQTGNEIANIPGTGAAGGIAAGLMGFCSVILSKGVELIAAASGIKDQLPQADLLITGEGKIDHQSSEGKVTGYMASLAKQFNIPCMAICGFSTLSAQEAATAGFQKIKVLAANAGEIPFAMDNAAAMVKTQSAAIIKLLVEK